MTNTDSKKIEELLTRGVDEVINKDDLREKLLSGKKLRIKLGIDPTSPNLHLGRSIPLLKLRDFQNLGHQVVFLVGNFTAVIGDTSDKDSERPMLADEMVANNMKTYIEQAAKILDIDKTEIVYNADWLGKLTYKEIGEQANAFSVAEFIGRDNIARRLEAGTRVSLREMLYPLMQGYDSVELHADVEVGGTDQRFNLLAGRVLQPLYNQVPQNILMTNLILGLDGRKMSSSWGNTINLTDSAREMFGKVMSMPDDLIEMYFEHCTRVAFDALTELSALARENPMQAKKMLAQEIVTMYHGSEAGIQELDWFTDTFSAKKAPSDMPVVEIALEETTAFTVVKTFFGDEKSNSDIKRLFEQGAISLNEEKLSTDSIITPATGDIWQVGKRTWFRIG